jgi:hypothetical protein
MESRAFLAFIQGAQYFVCAAKTLAHSDKMRLMMRPMCFALGNLLMMMIILWTE